MALASINVRDFTIVSSLELDLGPGLTVLTGETGAGKSIMIDALDLALGARGDTELIRHGSESAEVSAVFDIEDGSEAGSWLAEHELDEGGQCVIRRTLFRDRPTRSFINGRPATVQMLKELGSLMVDIHGQHDHQSLLHNDNQRRLVDDFDQITKEIDRLGVLFDEWQAMQKQLDALLDQAADRAAKLDLVRFQLEEIEKLELQAGEFFELEKEHERLAHASELQEGLQFSAELLYDADQGAAVDTLSQAVQKLERLAGYDDRLSQSVSLLASAMIEIEEAANTVRHVLDRTELDPGRLQWIESRLSTLVDLARKHRCEPTELVEVRENLRQQAAELEDIDVNIARLRDAGENTLRKYDELARTISTLRSEASDRLSKEVTGRMQELGMAGGSFSIRQDIRDTQPTRFGYDRLGFLVTTNPGQPLRPLSKVASGGELSRISLAIQVSSSQRGRVPTVVFDEVDVGVGGKVAEIVGQQLRKLSETRQVLCITHLPQVASQGHHHLYAEKRNEPDVSVTVYPLDAGQKVDEVARMLGGVEITPKTLDHARDMLARAGVDG